MTPETIAELRRLEAAATLGRWGYAVKSSNQAQETYVEMVSDAVKGSLFDTVNSDEAVIETEYDDFGANYLDVVGYANFKFIAALRNSAPALLDAAEENAKLRDLLRRWLGMCIDWPAGSEIYVETTEALR